jgi:hypothetical protein
MMRSASAPASNVPLTPWRLIMAAGVAVTALSAWGIPVPDHSRKLLTHSRSVMELFHLVSYRGCSKSASFLNFLLLTFLQSYPSSPAAA